MATQFDADVIVVGSGVLGSLTAHALAQAGKSVIMLEAGPRMPRWQLLERFRNVADKSDFNRAYPDQAWAPKSSGGPHSDDYLQNVGPLDYRPGMLKLVGGTTWNWRAAAWRLLPNDLRLKTLYGVGRDWPIDYDALEPWYAKAERALGVSGNTADDQSGRGGAAFPPRSQDYPLPMLPWSYYTRTIAAQVEAAGFAFCDEPSARASQPYAGRPACAGTNNCTPICPIGAQYSGDVHATLAEQAGAQLRENAVAFRLERAGAKIVAVHYQSPDGKPTRLSARAFVLAAHGIETPKLLLLSELANSSDQVGRNLMDHTGIGVTLLAREALWPGQGPVQQGAMLHWRDGEFRRRHAAIKHALGNAVPNRAVAARLLAQGVIGPELDRRIRHDAARTVQLATAFEMLPEPSNRVSLSDSKDALGLPKPQIHYDVDDYVRAAAAVARQDHRRIAEILQADVLDPDSGWRNGDHILGTTIMGADPRDSVVDGDCRTHDHENLFLATTGVMPAGGVVDPTLTGAALALRLADLLGRSV
jgi:choline dehydrogenase-like flavoprotein